MFNNEIEVARIIHSMNDDKVFDRYALRIGKTPAFLRDDFFGILGFWFVTHPVPVAKTVSAILWGKSSTITGSVAIAVFVSISYINIGIYFKSWRGVIGVLPIVTAVIGWCPAYLPFSKPTCETKQDCAFNIKKC